MRLLCLAAMLVPLLAWPQSAEATSFAPLSLQKLIDSSDFIVEAKVATRATEPETIKTHVIPIVTKSTLQVSRYLKGNGPDTLTLWQGGGTLNGVSVTVHGAAHMQVGDSMLLFLNRSKRGTGNAVLTALTLSAYHIRKGTDGRLWALRSPKASGPVQITHAMLPTAQALSNDAKTPPRSIPLADLTLRIQARVAETAPENLQ